MTASEIKTLLADRHALDVWIPECKSGSTWESGLRVLDGWAMKRSWRPWRTIGYEIKVARSDFTGDRKWRSYLPLCHEFSFVCPAYLIDVHDIDRDLGVGLVWATGGGRLHTRIKARRREVDVAAVNKVMAYALMSRARITKSTYLDPEGKTEEAA